MAPTKGQSRKRPPARYDRLATLFPGAHDRSRLRGPFRGTLADVGWAFLCHQALFLGAALVGASLIPAYSGGAYATSHTGAHWIVDASWRWDAEWYANIAAEGYRWTASGYQNVAFFPLYPLLIRILAAPWGEGAIPLVGALIPRFAFFAALAYLYRLAHLEHGREVAARAALYVAVYPTALFFSAAYPESLFLLTSVASFYYARRQRWWLAGAWGFLAALTRLQGVLLVIPVGYELWRHCPASPIRRIEGALAVLLVPAGLAVFMLHLHLSVGDALAFAHAQTAWLRSVAPPYETLYRAFQMAIAGEPDASRHAMGIINSAAAALFLVVASWSFKRQRPSYALYSFAAVVLPLSSPVPDMPTVSMARFTAVIFPVFFLIAAWGRQRHFHNSALVVSAALFVLLEVLFVNWYWVV